MTTRAKKKYVGRLVFDPDSGFHLAEDGKKVVTDDEGKTWHYATPSDPSHIARYERQVLTVDGTANSPDPEPHHFEVQPDDAHYDTEAENKTRLLAIPDFEAPKITGHTEAWK